MGKATYGIPSLRTLQTTGGGEGKDPSHLQDGKTENVAFIGSSALFRGAVVKRTYGTHKTPYIYIILQTTFGPIYYDPPY